MPVEFLTLTPEMDHADSVLGLMRHLYEHDDIVFDAAAARDALFNLVNKPERGIVWLMKDGDVPVGYAVVTFGYSLEFRGVDAFLDELYISASHRGQGLGRRAIELAEEHCRARGVQSLHLEVERSNTDAQAVYRKLGFHDHDRYLLTKWISR
ncbi:MAG: GNAT family N-acetyltransferase [Candidatus Hydrogenedentes bacterium]|nr:GNAT family N-acetyltransferase [Candidatus Hydrogenedentota bacterium]